MASINFLKERGTHMDFDEPRPRTPTREENLEASLEGCSRHIRRLKARLEQAERNEARAWAHASYLANRLHAIESFARDSY